MLAEVQPLSSSISPRYFPSILLGRHDLDRCIYICLLIPCLEDLAKRPVIISVTTSRNMRGGNQGMGTGRERVRTLRQASLATPSRCPRHVLHRHLSCQSAEGDRCSSAPPTPHRTQPGEGKEIR